MTETSRPRSPAPDAGGRLAWSTIFAYGLPGIGAGYMYLLMSLYVMKFSTDVLLIAPAVMGTIFMVSRIWDGISDPLAGYLSDRTRSPLGRRRIWMLGSIVPIAGLFLMVFAPPADLSYAGLVAWMAVAVIGFYTAITIFNVPHLSLGAELTEDYHERSRAFGARHLFFTLGSIVSLYSMQMFIGAERDSSEAARLVTFSHATVAIAAMAVLVCYACVMLRERFNNLRLGAARGVFSVYGDILGNRHARLLIIVTFIEHIGSAVIGTLTLYIAQYVVGRLDLAPLMILTYMVPSSLSVPLWVWLSRYVGKIRLWVFAQVLTGLSFGCAVLLPFLADESSRLAVIFGFAFMAGLAGGCGGTIGPSILGDVVDYDEYHSGERKEGSYYAAWNFAQKSAIGVMLMVTGFVLQISGFVPNQAQTMTVQLSMVGLYGAFPLVCYLVGATMFSFFSLDENAHGEIREELAKRRAAG